MLRLLIVLFLGLLTSYTVAVTISLTCSAEWGERGEPQPNLQLWPKSASPSVYWAATTMTGFGRRIDTASELPGDLLPNMPGTPASPARFAQRPLNADLSWYWVDVAASPPAALESIAATQLPPTNTATNLVVTSAGWPMLCTTGWRAWAPFGESQTGLFGPDTFNAHSHNDWIPFVPIPLGLGVNTLFYASLWFLLLSAGRRLVERRRQARGLCRRCSYPMGELQRCPECGKGVSST